MTVLEVIDDLLSRKLLDWTRDELEAARVCALKGALPSDEENYWRKVHARLQKTEIEHAAPEDLSRARIRKVFPLWAAQGPFQSGGASAAAMRSAMATLFPPKEIDQMGDGLFRHAVSYDSDPTEWEKTRRTWAMTESSFTAKQALRAWYFTTVPFAIGIGLLIANARFQWIDALNAIEHEWLAALFVVAIQVLIVPLPIYCAWRLLKFTLVRLFRVLLVAVSQAGLAWRGELRH